MKQIAYKPIIIIVYFLKALIPSIFEPGGIVALEALRYGAIPIVRRTGGLRDIIQNFGNAWLNLQNIPLLSHLLAWGLLLD